jgi:hypothetical protein
MRSASNEPVAFHQLGFFPSRVDLLAQHMGTFGVTVRRDAIPTLGK